MQGFYRYKWFGSGKKIPYILIISCDNIIINLVYLKRMFNLIYYVVCQQSL